MNEKKIIVTIDGPAAAGKGSISKAVANDLNFFYLETGLYYRILAKKFFIEGGDEKKIEQFMKLLVEKKFRFNFHDRQSLFNLKLSEISSILAQNKAVRNYILYEQRYAIETLPKKYEGILLEGRDCGTVIAPNANVKIFITADIKVRTERRFRQYLNKKKEISAEKILKDLQERDERDKKREVSPITKAKDAFLLDSTKKSLNEMIDIVKKIILSKIPTLKIKK